VTRVEQLQEKISLRKRELAEEVGALKALKETENEWTQRIAELSASIETYDKVSGVLSSIAEDRQQKVQEQIEILVTQGLQKIFGAHLSFHVVQAVKGRSPVSEFFIRTNLGNGAFRDTDIFNAMGGGIGAVAGFLLRLVVLMLSNTEKYATLVLDETFAHVSDSYLPALAEFLKEIVDKAKVQVVLVTHQKDFAEVADKAYRFSLNAEGYTVVAAL